MYSRFQAYRGSRPVISSPPCNYLCKLFFFLTLYGITVPETQQLPANSFHCRLILLPFQAEDCTALLRGIPLPHMVQNYEINDIVREKSLDFLQQLCRGWQS